MAEKDEVLVRVGEHVRDEQKDDVRFERVARGAAGPEEMAELEVGASSDPEMAVRLEGSRPFDGAAVERITARISKAQARAEVLPLHAHPTDGRSPWRRRVVLAAGPLALAAAMLVYVTAQRGPTYAELPAYSIAATGEQSMRGPNEAKAHLRVAKGAARDARFEIVLRPSTTPEGKIVAYGFTVGAEGREPAALDGKVELAVEGAVRITGSSRALDGAREVRIVIGDPSAIGKFDDAVARAASNISSARARVLVVPIDRE